MKLVLKIIVLLLVAFISCFVVAWGYQVFWNEIVLNIWQMFASTDVYTTMRIPYGVFLAITVGTGLIWTRRKDITKIDISNTEEFAKFLGEIFTQLLARICIIYITLTIVYIVF